MLAIGATLVSIYALYWLMTSIIPIMIVEAKYQYRNFLHNELQAQSLREIFLPNFDEFFDIRGGTDYPQAGIVIPKIFLDEPIIYNVDPNNKEQYTQALKNGIAHASSTAFPDNGGVGYYFAHSTSAEFVNQFKAVFYLLGKLVTGDTVFIWQDGKRYEYVVTHTMTTRPDNVSFLQQDYDKETIVLQTCWPPGTTQSRLLVFAERVE